MSPFSLATVSKPPTASEMERGGPNAATGVDNPFALLMKEFTTIAGGDTMPADAMPDQTEAEDTAPDDTSPQEPVTEVATMIPIVAAAALPVPIPVQTASADSSPIVVAEEGEPLQVPVNSAALSPIQTSGASPSLPPSPNGPIPGAAKEASPSPAPKTSPAVSVDDDGPTDPMQALLESNTPEDASAPLIRPSVNGQGVTHTLPGPNGTGIEQPPTLLKAHSHEPDLEADLSDPSDTQAFDTGNGAAPDRTEAITKPTLSKAAPEPSDVPDPGVEALPTATHDPKPVTSSTPADSRVPMGAIPHTIVRLASDPEQKTQTVKLRLDPPRLGEVSVDLKLGENGLTLRIVSQTPEARDLLQQDLPRLQDLLRANGLNLQLFSATCDLSDHRSERQPTPAFERTPRFDSAPAETSNIPATLVRRQYDTSMRINAHA